MNEYFIVSTESFLHNVQLRMRKEIHKGDYLDFGNLERYLVRKVVHNFLENGSFTVTHLHVDREPI